MDQSPFLVHRENQALVDGSTRRLAGHRNGLVWSLCLMGAFIGVLLLADSVGAAVGTDDQSSLLGWLFRMVLVLGWLFFCGKGLWWLWKQDAEVRKLEAKGVLLPGSLVKCFEDPDQDDTVYHFEYKFTPNGGSTMHGELRERGACLDGRSIPESGTAVVVYYLAPDIHRLL